MKHSLVIVCTLSMFVAIFFMGIPITLANHGHWIDHYSSAEGTACCGLRDCQKVHVRVVREIQEVVVVEVNGIMVFLPKKSLHPSEDDADYWCQKHIGNEISTANTRCIFLAVGA